MAQTQEIETLENLVTGPDRPERRDRTVWRDFRVGIEVKGAKSNITGYRPGRNWRIFTWMIQVFGLILKITGLFRGGNRRARDLRINELSFTVPSLPLEFDGYRIAHLSDLHFDRVDGVELQIAALLRDVTVDLIAFTGDYKDDFEKQPTDFEKYFAYLGKNLKCRDGIIATLGNHDTHDLVPIMESNHFSVLINESHTIERGGSQITLTGLDDVHYYYSERAIAAFHDAPRNSFKLALVHSPEAFREAEINGFSLYLCGHTHAGQIALPNGKALLAHLDAGREIVAGKWKFGNLQGYTTSGAGVSGLTVRFFTQSEIAIITLKRG